MTETVLGDLARQPLDHSTSLRAARHRGGDSGDRHRFRRVVRRRPLTSFFALGYLISWLPYFLSSSGLGPINLRIPEVLGTTQLLGVLPGAYLGPSPQR